MNKIYSIALLTFFVHASFCTQNFSADIRPAFSRSNTMFMEYVFIDKYNNEVASLNSYLTYAALTGLTTLIGQRIYSLHSAPEYTTTQQGYADAYQKLLPAATPAHAAYAALAGLIGYVTYNSYEKYVEKQACLQVLTKFLQEWETNKVYTPEAYHPLFDHFARIYTQKGAAPFIPYASEVVHGLQFIIKRTELKISDVYRKSFENASSANYIIDTAKDLGTLLDTLKNIVKF